MQVSSAHARADPARCRRLWPMLGIGVAILLAASGSALWLLRDYFWPPVVEYAMLGAMDIPVAIAVGPNGDVWFTIDALDAIGVVRDGRVEQIKKGSKSIQPIGLAVDRDGSVWYTEEQRRMIGRLTPDGAVTEFPVPAPVSRLGRIIADPGGGVWFTDGIGNAITRLRDGVFTPYPIPTEDAQPHGLALDADGNVWFTEQNTSKLGKLGPGGEIVEFEIPTRNSQPTDLAVDASGAIWFTEIRGNKIGRFAHGQFTEYPVPTERAALVGLAVAPDNSVWFTETRGGRIGRLRDGRIVEIAPPAKPARPFGIAIAPDGAVWYTDIAGRVGRVPPETARSR